MSYTTTVVEVASDQATPVRENRQQKRKLIDYNDGGKLHGHSRPPQRPKHTRAHKDYTVGWICALSFELTAARSMLDEEHSPLDNPKQDENSYVLGSMAGHNVVLVCLPKGVYGKSSAAVTATEMRYTFESLTTFLLVGIGGGAPRAGFDIRLGDVVVGVPTSDHPAVTQYDLGKTTGYGFHHRGSLNKPRTHLLNILSNLESAYPLKTSAISGYIDNALRFLGREYAYPGSTHDVLRKLNCEHIVKGLSCQCKTFTEIQRTPRDSTAPVIFYGPIASGDQVIKDQYTRDRIVEEHGVLCFEMEAAGLMDKLQALVIRGISDYCDATKAKNFQAYAALAAAAFAKELLNMLPNAVWQTDDNWTKLQEHRKSVMAAIYIGEEPSRVVKTAYNSTCEWILTHPCYIAWLNGSQPGTDLLWIRGKPGTGKSTLMRFLTDFGAQQQKDSSDLITIAFSFNKNGYEWESSTAGLYRSLCYQILSQLQHLQSLLDDFGANISTNIDRLRHLFTTIVEALGSRCLICFIDALDECSEEQIRDLLHTFEDIIKAAAKHRRYFRVLLSSRHYPGVYTGVGRSIILEQQKGHLDDLRLYINSKLRISDKIRKALEIDNKILQKSSNVFLWVSLVVEILNREHDKGRLHSLAKRLDEIPPKMNDLFLDILTRDTEHFDELITCIRWVLFAHRPLDCDELYFALLSADDDADLSWDTNIVSTEIMRNMILDFSKGLVEVTRSTPVKVQFIHETVRDFLTKSTVLQDTYPDFEGFSESRDNGRLQECCDRQVQCARDEFDKTCGQAVRDSSSVSDERSKFSFPFLKYAVAYVLKHADRADKDCQSETLNNFDILLWARMYNCLCNERDFQRQWKSTLEKPPWDSLEKRNQWDHALVKLELSRLLAVWWQLNLPEENVLLDLIRWFSTNGSIDGCETMLAVFYKTTLVTANDCLKHVRPLLTLFNNVSSITEFSLIDPDWANRYCRVIGYWHDIRSQDDLEIAIYIATRAKDAISLRILLGARAQSYSRSHFANMPLMIALVKPLYYQAESLNPDVLSCLSLLLDYGITLNVVDSDNRPLLALAIESTTVEVVKRLFEAGLEHPSSQLSWQSALRLAVDNDKVGIAQLLIARGARVDIADDFRQPLLHCVRSSRMAELLISHGSSVEASDDAGETALHVAVALGRSDVVNFLIDRGAAANATSRSGYTPMHHAVAADIKILPYLVSAGAVIDATTITGQTPLHIATHHDKLNVMSFLLGKGAEIDLKDQAGNTSLHIAAKQGLEAATSLLLHYGANIDMRDSSGRSPILVAKNKTVMRVLFEHGARLRFPPFSQEIDARYTTLLNYIAQRWRLRDLRLPCCEFWNKTTQEIATDILLREG